VRLVLEWARFPFNKAGLDRRFLALDSVSSPKALAGRGFGRGVALAIIPPCFL